MVGLRVVVALAFVAAQACAPVAALQSECAWSSGESGGFCDSQRQPPRRLSRAGRAGPGAGWQVPGIRLSNGDDRELPSTSCRRRRRSARCNSAQPLCAADPPLPLPLVCRTQPATCAGQPAWWSGGWERWALSACAPAATRQQPSRGRGAVRAPGRGGSVSLNRKQTRQGCAAAPWHMHQWRRAQWHAQQRCPHPRAPAAHRRPRSRPPPSL